MANNPVLIIEGDGDHAAVPELVRRTTAFLGQQYLHPVGKPIRCGDIKRLSQEGELERFLLYAASREEADSILLVIDCDDECPWEVAWVFGNRVNAIFLENKPVGFIFLKKEYEVLFLYSLESIARRYPDHGFDLTSPELSRDFDQVRDVKGLLSTVSSKKYKPTRDQARFTAAIDFDALSACRSFNHFVSVLAWFSGEEVHGTYPTKPWPPR